MNCYLFGIIREMIYQNNENSLILMVEISFILKDIKIIIASAYGKDNKLKSLFVLFFVINVLLTSKVISGRPVLLVETRSKPRPSVSYWHLSHMHMVLVGFKTRQRWKPMVWSRDSNHYATDLSNELHKLINGLLTLKVSFKVVNF